MKRVPKVMKGKYFWLVTFLVLVLVSFSVYYMFAVLRKPSYVANKEFIKTKSGGSDGDGSAGALDAPTSAARTGSSLPFTKKGSSSVVSKSDRDSSSTWGDE